MAGETVSFSAQIDEWCAKVQGRAEAVFREASQDVIEEMQVPEAAGGNLPVDLGFHRASLKVEMNAPPQQAVQKRPDDAKTAPAWDNGEVALVISGAKVGDTIMASYGMVYSRRLEYGFSGKDSLGRTYSQQARGFVRGAAANWQKIVDAATARVKAASGG